MTSKASVDTSHMLNFRLRMTSVSQILSKSKAPDAEEGQCDAMEAWTKHKYAKLRPKLLYKKKTTNS